MQQGSCVTLYTYAFATGAHALCAPAGIDRLSIQAQLLPAGSKTFHCTLGCLTHVQFEKHQHVYTSRAMCCFALSATAVMPVYPQAVCSAVELLQQLPEQGFQHLVWRFAGEIRAAQTCARAWQPAHSTQNQQ